MNKTAFKLSLLILLVATIMGSVPKKKQTKKQTVIWGFSIYPPFKFLDAGKPAGIDKLFVDQLEKDFNLKIEFVECPFKRCLRFLETGKIDFVTSYSFGEDRKKFSNYLPTAYYPVNIRSIYVRKDSGVKIESYEDFYKYKVGIKRGVKYFERFDGDKKLAKQEADSILSNLQKLDRGRVDVLINSAAQMDYMIAEHGFSDRIKKLKFTFPGGGSYIGLSKQSKLNERLAEIDAAISNYNKQGKPKQWLDQVVSQYEGM